MRRGVGAYGLVAGASCLLLWYKRVMIALADDASATGLFLAGCAAGFVLAALVSGRMGAPHAMRRAIGLPALASAVLTLVAGVIPGVSGVVVLAISAIPAAWVFLNAFTRGMAALPANQRGSAFAAVFFCAGLVNTATDLAELPMLRVAGLAPNLLFAALAAAGAVVAVFADASVRTPESADAAPASRRTSLDRASLLAAIALGLIYLASSLKDTVAYPTAVEAVSPSGFVRFVELPFWLAAAYLTDRVGRAQTVTACVVLALLGGAGLLAEPGTLVAGACTLCSYASMIIFPTVATAAVVDSQAKSPWLPAAGALCFMPVPMGAAAGAAVGAAGWSNEARYLALAAVLVAFSYVALRLSSALSADVPDVADEPDAPGVAIAGTVSSSAALGTAGAVGDVPRSNPDAFSSQDFAPDSTDPALLSAAVANPDALTRQDFSGEHFESESRSAWVAATAERAHLTSREAEVLALVAEGRTAQQIADELVVTRSTAKYHITNILKKTGAPTRAALLATALPHA